MGQRFFRNQHIRLRSEFEKFRSRGVAVFLSEMFTLKILDGGLAVDRLGIIASKKIGVMFGNPETTPGGRALKF
jgi:RNase P protein component